MSFDMTLKNLSAVANTLKAETEELNRVIADLNTRIAQTGIGVSVWLDHETILLDSKQAEEKTDDGEPLHVTTGWALGYCKTDDVWTIAVRKTERLHCLAEDNGSDEFSWENPIPLLKAPRNVRIEAAPYLEMVLVTLGQRAAQFVQNIAQAKKALGGGL